MGGLSPEYLQQVQQGIGGLGQGALLGQLMKQRQGLQQQNLDVKALEAGFQRAPEGTPTQPTDVSLGGQQFSQIPTTLDPIKVARLEQIKVNTELTRQKIKLLGVKESKVDPGVRQVLMDFMKQTEGGDVPEEIAGSMKALLKAIGAPIDVVQEISLSKRAKLQNWISKNLKIPFSQLSLIPPSIETPQARGKFKFGPKQPTIADLSSLSTEDLQRLANPIQ